MRRTVLATLVLLGTGLLVALLVAALARDMAPRPAGSGSDGAPLTVRAWVPQEVVQADGTRVWIVSDHAGTLMLPFVLVPATPVPYVPGSGPPIYAR